MTGFSDYVKNKQEKKEEKKKKWVHVMACDFC